VIKRLFQALAKKLAKWFRRAAREPRGKLFKGMHAAFGRSFSLVQLTAGRRPYFLYLPVDYRPEKQLPLIVMLHGCRQDAATFIGLTRMNGIADRDGFLVLYPEQRRLANALRCWNWFSRSAQAGAGEADLNRVYLAGLSAGAAMAGNLAVCHADLFAACALHSGLAYGAATSSHEAMKAMRDGAQHDAAEAARRAFVLARGKTGCMPLMVIHGEDDDVVNPVNAGQAVSQFAELNQLLAARPAAPTLPVNQDISTHQSGSGYRYTVTDLNRSDQLISRHVMVTGLGHAWSGGPDEYHYSDPRGPNASELICDFFAEHGLRDAAPVAAAAA
jgi:poly(hydroxyalkanoate) depolymerase family esterase